MPNKCAAFGCKTNYDTKTKCFRDVSGEKVSTFYFPFHKPTLLLQLWIKFINRAEFARSEYSVFCEKHFDEILIKLGKKINKLQWKLNPIPNIHTEEARKRPSMCQTPSEPRTPPPK